MTKQTSNFLNVKHGYENVPLLDGWYSNNSSNFNVNFSTLEEPQQSSQSSYQERFSYLPKHGSLDSDKLFPGLSAMQNSTSQQDYTPDCLTAELMEFRAPGFPRRSASSLLPSKSQSISIPPGLQGTHGWTSTTPHPWAGYSANTQSGWSPSTNLVEDTDEEEEGQLPDTASASSHPNKYSVEVESHSSKHCQYRRQSTRSGEKIKTKLVKAYDPVTLQPITEVQQIKYYQKHLVRICRCGRYQALDGALQHGRTNDCNGYEIHYSQKCKWKAYDDFKTGERVLIRLCKCYKPG